MIIKFLRLQSYYIFAENTQGCPKCFAARGSDCRFVVQTGLKADASAANSPRLPGLGVGVRRPSHACVAAVVMPVRRSPYTLTTAAVTSVSCCKSVAESVRSRY